MGKIIGESLSMTYATIVVAIILIVSWFLITLLGSAPASVFSEEYDSGFKITASLPAYLEAPIDVLVDGKTKSMKMIDLIRLASIDESYSGLLRKETEEIFDAVFLNGYYFEIEEVLVIDKSVKTLAITKTKVKEISVTNALEELPLPGNIKIIIKA